LGPRGQWLLNGETWKTAMNDVVQAGFSAVSIEIPEGVSAQKYHLSLLEQGIRPAPGYFGADLHDVSQRPEILRTAQFHAQMHRELGVDHTFIASNLSPERTTTPSIGAFADEARITVIAETIEMVRQVMVGEGVVACFHQHVGSWVETQDELDFIMNANPELMLGPDTGHLFWAGMDPVEVFGRYKDRIAGVHIKDASLSAITIAHERSLDYFDATHIDLWRELGAGDVDLTGALAILPPDFQGWFVVEVDVPSLPSASESTRASGRWVQKNFISKETE
jgi:inosose dehydratase